MGRRSGDVSDQRWSFVRGGAQALLLGALGLLLASCSLILKPTLDDDDCTPVVDDDDSAVDDDDDSAGIQPGDVEFGGMCEGDLDCQSLLCRDRRCTQTCSDLEPCPADSYSTCEEEICRFSVAPPLQDIPRVGFVYVGPVGDHGWTLTHELSPDLRT
jgi:hypothetical protein